MMTMKPTTTPGKASGSVSTESRVSRPKKRLRSRKTPAIPAMTSVAAVTATESAIVDSSASR
jgi:hypothetical protein